MECTQRLESTQDLYDTHSERTCPEQIGFLGICGEKHPVLKGPNKIGRDPQTCSIILNLNSVSRQHAVINVLNSTEFMLMDLDSANKTKLLNKILQPYIPHPLRNGDTVQFGDIFGIFRLLEEDDALPMTQAIDIPETPVISKHVSKLHKAPTTMIPESPEVSDRDDSFTTTLQKSKLSNSPFTKPFNKTLSVQPGSSPKTYSNRNSSIRSTSLTLTDNPNTSLNESFISLKCDKTKIADNIHEMDTQAPNPIANDSTDSIYTADTQIPTECAPSPSIHSLDTQLPTTEHLPQVRKIDDQHDMQFDIYAANKENNRGIYNAETQLYPYDKVDSMKILNINKSNLSNKTMLNRSPKAESKEKLNISEEGLLFEEVDECFEDDFNSQNILPEKLPFEEHPEQPSDTKESTPIPPKRNTTIQSDDSTDCEDIEQKIPELLTKENKKQVKIEAKNDSKASKRTARIKSDSSTDCEDIDIAPTQKIPEMRINVDTIIKVDEKIKTKPLKRINRIQSDSSTDCEDIDIPATQKISELPVNVDTIKRVDEKSKTKPLKRVSKIQSDSSTDCEDIDMIPTQKILVKKVDEDNDGTDCEEDVIEVKTKFEDMPTQIIDVDLYQKDKVAFEDLPTQVIDVDEEATTSNNVSFEDQPTQIIDEVPEPTKVTESIKKSFDEIISPFKIPLQSPIRVKSKDITKLTPKDKTSKSKPVEIDDNYYNATQDIYEDLCSQKETSPIIELAGDEVVPCSVEDYKVREKFANIDRELSPTKKLDDERVKDFITNLSSQEVRDVIGVNEKVAKLKKVPSDSSDVESTPKKTRPFLFTDSDLPDSQEIKTSMISHTRSVVTESSSESETENYSEEITPFLHRKKKTKPVSKLNLTKKFEIEKLPERVITRQRKPTTKLQESAQIEKKLSANMLKPTYWMGQEDQIDGDIITENIKRLKTYEKAKSSKESKNDESIKEVKKERKSRKKPEDKSNELNEKFKVKIEKPKQKDTKSKSQSSTHKNKESDKDKTKEDSVDSTSVAKITTRRTRGKNKESDSKTTKKKSVSPENTKKEADNKRKRSNRGKEKSKSPEIEIRRSKRQQQTKEKIVDETLKCPKSILKKSMHEQSTVYNISSSSTESLRVTKRSLVDDDTDVPSPKRTRSFANNSTINNASLRATPARVMKTHVLLTAFPSEEVKQKLEKLGAVIVTDVLECSVVLTMQVKRTFKLLCAVGLGRPIVGPGWVQACVDTNMIVDPWLYLVKDEPAEKRFQFKLERTLTGKRSFLKGFNVSSTPSVQPNSSEMKLIVECSGGTWKEGGSNWVCVSCSKDNGLWPSLRKRGATIVSTEFILGGVLRQNPDVTTNKFN